MGTYFPSPTTLFIFYGLNMTLKFYNGEESYTIDQKHDEHYVPLTLFTLYPVLTSTSGKWVDV